MNNAPEIDDLLERARTVAVVGLSPNPERPSHRVGKYLHEQGYRVIPVNPMTDAVFGEKSAPSLEAIEERVDVVDVFRRSEEVPAIVESAIRIGAKAVWMQEGVVHEEAAQRAEEAGLTVVMDRCMLKEREKRFREGRRGDR